MQLDKVIQDKVQEVLTNGSVDKMIEKHLSKTIEEILRDALGEYSELGKQIKEVIKEKLKINLDELNIDGYGAVVKKIIEDKVNGSILEHYSGMIGKHVEEAVSVLEKKEWTLTEVSRKYWSGISSLRQDDSKLEIEVDRRDESWSSTMWVRIGHKEKDKYSSYLNETSHTTWDVRIMMDKKTNLIKGVWYEGKQPNPLDGKMWNHNIQVFLMQLWLNECTLTIDVQYGEDVDTDGYPYED